MLVEFETAERLEALLAPVLVVRARRVPLLCAARAHEVSVESHMVIYNHRVPRARIKHVFASRTPVAVGDQALIPETIAFDTTFAY